MADISVNPDVLKWARKIRGLSVDAAAQRLGIPKAELEDYESRRRRPNVTMLQRMAQKYQINYAGLLMPEPIEDLDEKPLPDYRLRHGGDVQRMSVETHVAIHELRGTLETLVDLKNEAPTLFGSGVIETVEQGEDSIALATRQRRKFRVTIHEQLAEWHSDAVARERWRREIERRGVFVYFMPLGDECSGFTLHHEGLFAICVNDKHTTNGARIFTLFHEYCHVLRRQTGISDENYVNPVERFCNKFAAAFLIPMSSLVAMLGEATARREFSTNDVSRIAKRFKVSWTAMGLRLENLGYAKRGLYERINGIVKASVRAPVDPRRKVKIDPVLTQARRLGNRHTMITLNALSRGVINAADARALLGIEPARFSLLRAAVE